MIGIIIERVFVVFAWSAIAGVISGILDFVFDLQLLSFREGLIRGLPEMIIGVALGWALFSPIKKKK